MVHCAGLLALQAVQSLAIFAHVPAVDVMQYWSAALDADWSHWPHTSVAVSPSPPGPDTQVEPAAQFAAAMQVPGLAVDMQ